jgi:hypothetical protein
MRRGQRILLLGSLGGNLLLLVALLSSHHRSARIQAELAASQREQSRQMAILSELESAAKSQPASKPSLSDSELVELARLRNEVTRLRGEQRAAAPTNSPSVRRSPVPAPAPVPAAPPVTKLTSTVTAQVPLGHALAIGGWTGAEPGQRIVGFVTPATDANAPGQVLLQTHLVTIPDRLLDRLGLQDLRTGENSSQAAAGLDSARLAALLKLADQTAGVSVHWQRPGRANLAPPVAARRHRIRPGHQPQSHPRRHRQLGAPGSGRGIEPRSGKTAIDRDSGPPAPPCEMREVCPRPRRPSALPCPVLRSAPT